MAGPPTTAMRFPTGRPPHPGSPHGPNPTTQHNFGTTGADQYGKLPGEWNRGTGQPMGLRGALTPPQTDSNLQTPLDRARLAYAAMRGTVPISPTVDQLNRPGGMAGFLPPGAPRTAAPAAVVNPGVAPEKQTAGGLGFRGSTQAEVEQFMKDAPSDAKEVAGVAGTGNTAVTKFGTASSSMPSGPQGPLVGDQSTGPKHAPGPTAYQQEQIAAQNQIIKDHPAIGVAGSPENKAFVAAHKADPTADLKSLADKVSPARAAEAANVVSNPSGRPDGPEEVPQYPTGGKTAEGEPQYASGRASDADAAALRDVNASNAGYTPPAVSTASAIRTGRPMTAQSSLPGSPPAVPTPPAAAVTGVDTNFKNNAVGGSGDFSTPANTNAQGAQSPRNAGNDLGSLNQHMPSNAVQSGDALTAAVQPGQMTPSAIAPQPSALGGMRGALAGNDLKPKPDDDDEDAPGQSMRSPQNVAQAYA